MQQDGLVPDEHGPSSSCFTAVRDQALAVGQDKGDESVAGGGMLLTELFQESAVDGCVGMHAAQSIALCGDPASLHKEAQFGELDGGSPPSVALSCWGRSGPGLSSERANDADAGPGSGGIMIGSIKLMPIGMAGLQPFKPVGGSMHLLALSQERIPSLMDMENEVDPTDLTDDGGGLDCRDMHSPMAVARSADLVRISLSDQAENAICSPYTGDSPCRPCNSCSPLDLLRRELSNALSPIIARLPSKEPLAPKRRPRKQRQPVSNPRRSVRIA